VQRADGQLFDTRVSGYRRLDTMDLDIDSIRNYLATT
jgi:hypothetical protein